MTSVQLSRPFLAPFGVGARSEPIIDDTAGRGPNNLLRIEASNNPFRRLRPARLLGRPL